MPDPTPIEPTPTPAPTPTAPPTPPPSVEELASRLAAEIRRTAPPIPAPQPVAPPPAPPTREAILDRLNKAGEQGAGKFAEEFANSVLSPMQAANLHAAAQLNRRIVERDPVLSPLYVQYRDAIDRRLAELGGDAYIAEKGLDGVIRAVAAEDPAYIDSLATARIAERDAAAEAARKVAAPPPAPPTPPRAPTESVHSGPIAAPSAPSASPEEEIRRVQVSDEEVAVVQQVFGMSADDLRRQRWEIAQMERRYGAIGIKQLGGTPICELSDLPGDEQGRPAFRES